MSFTGPALQDVHAIREAFPRGFTHQEVMDRFDWPQNKARQAIVMGVSQDYFRILGAEDQRTQWVTYENAQWRRNWLTTPWVGSWVHELESVT